MNFLLSLLTLSTVLFLSILLLFVLGKLVWLEKATNSLLNRQPKPQGTDAPSDADPYFYGLSDEALWRAKIHPEIICEDLNENEKKLGYALIDLFSNYDNIFSSADNNKFNKNIILLTLREMTNLTTKEIRSSMKRYKVMYVGLIQKMVK